MRHRFLSIARRSPTALNELTGGKTFAIAIAVFGVGLLSGQVIRGQSILGSMGDYALMSGSTVTNTGVTAINGDLGGTTFAGSGSYVLTGTQISPITAGNQSDFVKAFNGLAAMTPSVDLTGQILGASTLVPGIYKFDSTAQLTGSLVLDAQNQDHAVWVFQIGSTLTTAAGSGVTFANLAPNSVANNGVFWQVGTSTTFGANTAFVGNVLNGTTLSFGTGTSIDGRALSGTGAVTLSANAIDFYAANSGYGGGLAFDFGGNVVAVPEPGTYAVLAGAAALVAAALRRRRVTLARVA